uniref:Retrotransposon gag domain-containing protein n=1 Tax=Aegilops tauschii TaxID=37682 RepID=N1QY73_AEGTA
MHWDELCTALGMKFGREQYQVHLRQFRLLKQTGTVHEYMLQFEEIMHHLLAHNLAFDPVFFTTQFLEGLKHEIRVERDTSRRCSRGGHENRADAVLEAAMKTGLKAREEVYATLLEQLLASFANPLEDSQLREWECPPKPHYSLTEKRSGPRQDPKCPFFLINLKVSAKAAQISWSMKKYPRFPRERAMHDALRVARLGTGTQGFLVEQAGEGGQPGALSYFIDATYSGWPRPKEGIFEEGSSVPLREVAVIKRLPGGDGISVMSYVHGLGVKLDDILFVLHVPSAAMPLRFTEQYFRVSENFEEIPLYAPAGLDFIDINVPVKNLIKKLYQLYLQEEQEKNIKREKHDHQGSEELVCSPEEFMLQRHEQEGEKLERLRRRREESKKHRDLRKEMKEAVHRIKDAARTSEEEEQHEEEYDPMLLRSCFKKNVVW